MATILILHNGHGLLRGSDKVVITLVEELKHTHRFIIVTDHAALCTHLQRLGYDALLRTFPEAFAPGLSMRKLATGILGMIWLTQLVLQRKPDVIHANNGHFSYLALIPSLIRNVPVLAHLHAPLSRRTQILFGICATDRIVGVARFLTEVWLPCPRVLRKCVTIYNGIRPPAPAPPRLTRPTLAIPPQQFVLMTTSVLAPQKGVDVAIEAVRRLVEGGRAVTLLVLGDGPERARLEQMAAGLPVIFLGYRDDVADLLAGLADAMVLPSTAAEAHSIALLEAAALGVPRIASAIPGNIEAVTDGRDGLLFPPADPAGLAAAVGRLMDDRSLTQQLAAEARQRVEREFSVEQFRNSFDKTWREMIAERPSRWRRLIGMIRALRDAAAVRGRKL